MKQIILLFSISLCFAFCSNNSQDNNASVPTKDSITENLLQVNTVKNNVALNHKKFIGVAGNLKSFQDFIQETSDYQVTSIASALDYINTCIPPGSPDQDLIFRAFYIKSDIVAANVSDMLENTYTIIGSHMDKELNSPELTVFKQNLKTGGFEIFTTEGIYYVSVASDFQYDNFKNRVSASMKEFLRIRKDELKQGFSEDAEMVISFDELYKRVKSWENYLNTYPNALFYGDANYFYSMYLSTLLTGMDNSQIYDYSTNTLLPEIKALYEKIIQEDKGSRTSKIIAAYYSLLEQHDFKDNDEITKFLEDNNLSTMQAVQPTLR
jgi:hypothetical protein